MFFVASIVTAQTANESNHPQETSEPEPSLRELWTFTLVNSSWNNSPVIADGIAYLFNTEYYTKPSELYLQGLLMFGPPSHPLVTVYALNASDGLELWQYQAQGELQLFTIDKGAAYFSTTDICCLDGQYSGAHVYALNASSGDEKWVYNVDGMIFGSKFDSPHGVFYALYVASGSLDSYVSAINTTNGEEIWRYKFGYYIYPIRFAISEDAIYFGVNNYFYSLNTSDGKILWKATLESSYEDVAPTLGDQAVYFNSKQMTHALTTQNGSPLWNYSAFSYPISSNGIGYVRDGKTVYSYDGVSGNKVWSYSFNETIYSLELFDNVLYVCLNGTLITLNVVDGTQLWNYSLPEKRFVFSPYYRENTANLLISNGTLFCYSGKTLSAIDISNGKTLWDYTDYDRSLITVTDGLAFFKTAHAIYALSIPDIVPSPLQSGTEKSLYLGLTIEGWIIILIVSITILFFTVFLAKKRNKE